MPRPASGTVTFLNNERPVLTKLAERIVALVFSLLKPPSAAFTAAIAASKPLGLNVVVIGTIIAMIYLTLFNSLFSEVLNPSIVPST